jgi:hypothetical protein
MCGWGQVADLLFASFGFTKLRGEGHVQRSGANFNPLIGSFDSFVNIPPTQFLCFARAPPVLLQEQS